MPTSHQEVKDIKNVVSKYFDKYGITAEDTLGLFCEINEIGEKSDNQSFKISTRMLRLIYESPKKLTWFLRIVSVLLFLLTCLHHCLFICNILFPFIAVLVMPWIMPAKYLILMVPSIIYSVNLPFTNVQCSFTKAENALRLLLGKQEMKSFVHEYYVKPYNKYFRHH